MTREKPKITKPNNPQLLTSCEQAWWTPATFWISPELLGFSHEPLYTHFYVISSSGTLIVHLLPAISHIKTSSSSSLLCFALSITASSTIPSTFLFFSDRSAEHALKGAEHHASELLPFSSRPSRHGDGLQLKPTNPFQRESQLP